jgi:stage III sporulation protein AC
LKSKRNAKEFSQMDVGLLLKVVGAGMLVAVAYQILNKAGREEQAMLVSLAGVVIVMLVLVEEIGDLFNTVRTVFGF